MPAAELFATRLDTHARERPEAVALIDRDRPVTHAALRRRAGPGRRPGGAGRVPRRARRAVAAQLRALGDDVPGLRPPGRADARGQYPLSRPGAGRHSRARPGRLAGLLAGLEGHRLRRHPGRRAARRTRAPARRHRRGRERRTGYPGPAGLAAHALAALHGPAPLPAPNAGVLCFTTSGTTSLPKFVLHDQDTLLRHGDAIARSYGYDDDSRILASAPFAARSASPPWWARWRAACR